MDGLAAREAELLRLDQELEAKQKRAVEDANNALQEQESRLKAILGKGEVVGDSGFGTSGFGGSPETPTGSVTSLRVEEDPVQTKHSAKVRGVPSKKRGQQSRNNDHNSENSPGDVTPKEMGSDAVIRLQRAKLKVLAEDVEKSHGRIKVLEEHNTSLKKRNKAGNEEITKLTKRIQSMDAAREKEKRENEKNKTRIAELEAQLVSVQRELKKTDKTVKQATNEGTSKDVRLNRALEEVEKYRTRLQENEAAKKEAVDNAEGQVKKVKAEVRRLERQKTELLAAFRKQLKLIDVLKRQKIHLEAAKMLSFTEDEFTRTLEAHN
mmetsp:Transcript_10674/g.17431  ORF Transcript_10674/g.17431 Transcript_10674/m.17431 type:complete len:323 (-) Transcript_10674:1023-1991(-)|eukprot:CAMPEP_0203744624 /NCGR_PEP_ID=MMETSP0098-20131031/632_1 /ASSEMBLY_ACC=CAM_ASM_000208 /TAXON_ID=96639 /ORGANISM=" , Strain NY0313808BC1" /LENGTH=322 /DNA_ID=CAMNT_0050632197 /DNA_START=147 /DNA_END=1115 /DNA_ORIENTATION=-